MGVQVLGESGGRVGVQVLGESGGMGVQVLGESGEGRGRVGVLVLGESGGGRSSGLRPLRVCVCAHGRDGMGWDDIGCIVLID